MKVTIELHTQEEIKSFLGFLSKDENTQPTPPAYEVTATQAITSLKGAVEKAEQKIESKRGRKPNKETAPVETNVVEAPAKEATENEAPEASAVEPQEGDIDDSKMREIGAKLLRELNAKGKDGVGKLTEILSSLSSKKVTEVPMNLRPRFVAKVEEALA